MDSQPWLINEDFQLLNSITNSDLPFSPDYRVSPNIFIAIERRWRTPPNANRGRTANEIRARWFTHKLKFDLYAKAINIGGCGWDEENYKLVIYDECAWETVCNNYPGCRAIRNKASYLFHSFRWIIYDI